MHGPQESTSRHRVLQDFRAIRLKPNNIPSNLSNRHSCNYKMASTTAPSSLKSFLNTLPPDLFDQTTLISLASTVAILVAAYSLSRLALDPKTTTSCYRFLFIWHAFDALIHFCLEGSFLYHCFFSSAPLGHLDPKEVFVDPYNYLGRIDKVHGAQAVAGRFVEGLVGGPAKAGAVDGLDGGFLEKIVKGTAELWMVYAKADKRWAGVDLVSYSCDLLSSVGVRFRVGYDGDGGGDCGEGMGHEEEKGRNNVDDADAAANEARHGEGHGKAVWKYIWWESC